MVVRGISLASSSYRLERHNLPSSYQNSWGCDLRVPCPYSNQIPSFSTLAECWMDPIDRYQIHVSIEMVFQIKDGFMKSCRVDF
jgi:hypothetical protein